MDKQKEIEKIGKIMCEEFNSEICGNECECANKAIAERLINAGYGNVKQAVREFAERLKKEFINYLGGRQACIKIDELVKEICGE